MAIATNIKRKGAPMAEPTKIVKGGFRATLALIISLLALFLSIIAYTSAGKEEGLRSHIKELQSTIEKMKTESSQQLNNLRNETAEALEKMSQAVRKKEAGKMGSDNSAGKAGK